MNILRRLTFELWDRCRFVKKFCWHSLNRKLLNISLIRFIANFSIFLFLYRAKLILNLTFRRQIIINLYSTYLSFELRTRMGFLWSVSGKIELICSIKQWFLRFMNFFFRGQYNSFGKLGTLLFLDELFRIFLNLRNKFLWTKNIFLNFNFLLGNLYFLFLSIIFFLFISFINLLCYFDRLILLLKRLWFVLSSWFL